MSDHCFTAWEFFPHASYMLQLEDLSNFTVPPVNHTYRFYIGSEGKCWIVQYLRKSVSFQGSPAVVQRDYGLTGWHGSRHVTLREGGS